MDNINDIIASLSPEDIENLKKTAESVFGSGGFPKTDKAPNTENKSSGNNSSAFPNGMDIGSMISPEMFGKIAQIMSAMNSDGGKRCHLIEALKPNLSTERQKKADEAIQMMKLMEILPFISNLGNKED